MSPCGFALLAVAVLIVLPVIATVLLAGDALENWVKMGKHD